MSVDEFRRMALSFPEAEESAHMGHPDFRVRGKIFATLGYPADGWGMVALSATDQQLLVAAQPAVFVPAKGAWGRRGATTVLLKAAKKSTVRDALAAAWRNKAPTSLARQAE
jgi:hypothetical protein